MKIGIDLDGVVFDTENLWAVLAEIYDTKEIKQNSIVNKEEVFVEKRYNWSSEQLKTYFDKYLFNIKFNLVAGAKEVLNLLHEEGYELIVVTSRGSISIEGKNQAMKKIVEENLPFDKYYWAVNDKAKVCKDENIDFMIDDNFHICKSLEENKIKTLYFRILGRKKLDENEYLTEVYNWGEIYRIINESRDSI